MRLFEVQLSYSRLTGNDTPSMVKERYVVECMTPIDAEHRVAEFIHQFVLGDYEVERINQCSLFDIISSQACEYWYKARIETIVVDGNTERRKVVSALVQADNLKDALDTIHKKFYGYDFEIIAISRSSIVDVFFAN